MILGSESIFETVDNETKEKKHIQNEKNMASEPRMKQID